MRRKLKCLFSAVSLKKGRRNAPLAVGSASDMSRNHLDPVVSESDISRIVSSSVPTTQSAEASGAQVRGEQLASVHSQSGSSNAAGLDHALGFDESAHSAPAVLSLASPPSLVPVQATTPETTPSLADSTPAPAALVAPSPGKPEQAPGTPTSSSAHPGLGAGARAVERYSASADPPPPTPSPAASTLCVGGPEQDPATAARLPPTPLCLPALATAAEPISAASPPAPQDAVGSRQRGEATLSLGAGSHTVSLLAPRQAGVPASVAEPSESPALLLTPSSVQELTSWSRDSSPLPPSQSSVSASGPAPYVSGPSHHALSAARLVHTLPSPQPPTLPPISTAGRSESELDAEGTSPPPVIAGPPSHLSAGGMPYASSTGSENLTTAEDQHVPRTSHPQSRPSPLDDLLERAFTKFQETTGIDPNRMTLPLPRDSDDKALNKFIEECLKRCTQPRNRVTEQCRTPIFKTASFLRRFCIALGEGTALAFPAGKVVFAALEVLLRAAEGPIDSVGWDISLVFFKHLKIYPQVFYNTYLPILVHCVRERIVKFPSTSDGIYPDISHQRSALSAPAAPAARPMMPR